MLTKPQLKKLEREAAKLADKLQIEKLKRFAAVEFPKLKEAYLGKAFKHTAGAGDTKVTTYFLVTKVEHNKGWTCADVTYVEFYRGKSGFVLYETTSTMWDNDGLFTGHTPITFQEFDAELQANLDRLAETWVKML